MSTTASHGAPLTVFGRNEAGDWLQMRGPDSKGGRASAGLVVLNVAVSVVPLAADFATLAGW